MLLAGGTINSPQLLMLSGHRRSGRARGAWHSGQGAAARRRQESAGPCRGAHHLCAARGAGPVHRNMRLDRLAAGAGARLCASAPASPPTCRAASRRSSRPTRRESARHPAAVHRRAADGARPICRRSAGDLPTAFPAASFCCVRESRGQRRARVGRSAGGIRASTRNLLATERDWKTLRAAIALFRDIARQAKPAALHRERAGTRPRHHVGRAAGALHARHRRDRASSGRHLPHGPGVGRRRAWSIPSCA